MLDRRIQNLEEKFAYQEKTIDALNDVIIEQQAQISNLEEELKRLRSLVEQFGENRPEIINTPPPHY